jgi:hypothetical protein
MSHLRGYLLDQQQRAELRVADPGQTAQIPAGTVSREPSRGGDNFGVDGIDRANRKETVGMAETGRVQRSFQLRIAHNDRDAQAVAQLDARIGGILLE